MWLRGVFWREEPHFHQVLLWYCLTSLKSVILWTRKISGWAKMGHSKCKRKNLDTVKNLLPLFSKGFLFEILRKPFSVLEMSSLSAVPQWLMNSSLSLASSQYIQYRTCLPSSLLFPNPPPVNLSVLALSFSKSPTLKTELFLF